MPATEKKKSTILTVVHSRTQPKLHFHLTATCPAETAGHIHKNHRIALADPVTSLDG